MAEITGATGSLRCHKEMLSEPMISPIRPNIAHNGIDYFASSCGARFYTVSRFLLPWMRCARCDCLRLSCMSWGLTLNNLKSVCTAILSGAPTLQKVNITNRLESSWAIKEQLRTVHTVTPLQVYQGRKTIGTKFTWLGTCSWHLQMDWPHLQNK